MKFYELKAIAKHLKKFKYITRARRVEDNTVELSFDKDNSYFFHMVRGESFIYKSNSIRPPQSYNAPFDTLLHSLVSASKILDITLPNSDRIIRFHLAPKSNYKRVKVYLQFEFTGRHTNIILLDEDEIIIEALRHIDGESSFRVVRPSLKLEHIPPMQTHQRKNIGNIEDIDKFLTEKFLNFEKRRVNELKQQKLKIVAKKQEKLKRVLKRLQNPKELKQRGVEYQNRANIILANLHKIKPYDTKLETYDFDGKSITIELPKGILPNRMSEYFFNQAKRMRNKAKNIHIELENLTSKMEFYSNMYYAIEMARSKHELELLLPKRGKAKRKREKIRECELFWIDDYKILIGRNSKENQALLKMARANDIWMHIRDIPSSHLIIKTDKQNLPKSVIERAGKLCVDFSIKMAGDYMVDYCKRKFVKIQEGSRVEYDKYKTLVVRKDGIEIRE